MLKYLYDITGIMKNLSNPEFFGVMGELVLEDLKLIIQGYLATKQSFMVLGDERVRKAFMNLFRAILEKHDCPQSRSELTARLPVLVEPIWDVVLRCSHFEYGKQFLSVWKLLIQINPIKPLPPLPNLTLRKQKA